MRRTTIMLPADLRLRAIQYANQLGISLGELIRKSLSSLLQGSATAVKKDSLFSDKGVFRGRAPRDLAQNHDRYLYGDEEA
jgi:hypothetical protein